MAKRSFGSQLARGFVRAAVNQVGRDGGRVISNQIYNGRNYVPVANVTPGEQPYVETIPNQSYGVPDYAQSTTKKFSGGKIVLLSLLSLLLMLFGGIGVFIYGLVTYLKKSDKLVWYEQVPQYTIDRRYRTKERYVGDVTQKREQVIMASPEAIEINKHNGIIAMAIGAVGIILYIIEFIIVNH